MLYILDTNIVSEAMKSNMDENVHAWLNTLETEKICITSISLEEITFGLLAMPSGKRQQGLVQAFSSLLDVIPVLDFDQEAAVRCAKLRQKRKASGIPISYADAQIASIAQRNDHILATRNTKDFVELELNLINPFEGKSGEAI